MPAAMILSLIFSFIIAPFVRRAALFAGILDIPRDGRRMHKRAVPLAGGWGMILAFTAVSIFFCSVGERGGAYVPSFSLMCFMCGIYGTADDKFALKVPSKLAFQFFAAVLASLFLGRAEAFSFFGSVYSLGWLSLPVTAVWIVFMMNAVNLTDGMDGLASGTSAVSAAALCVLHFLRGYDVYAVCAAALCGACIGFLFHNAAPAKVFMGETGSAFLGFALAVLSLPLFSQRDAASPGELALAFLFPISEAVSSFLRRTARGKNPFAPDKEHMHHLLYGKGLSVPLVCLTLYIFTLLCAFCAVTYKSHAVFAACAFTLAVVFIRLMLSGKKL